MTPEVAELLAQQIRATAQALTKQLVLRSKREPQPDRYLFDALARLSELSPLDKDVDAIARGLDQFAAEYQLDIPNLAGSDAQTPQTGWLQ
jgi:hypothetical protein